MAAASPQGKREAPVLSFHSTADIRRVLAQALSLVEESPQRDVPTPAEGERSRSGIPAATEPRSSLESAERPEALAPAQDWDGSSLRSNSDDLRQLSSGKDGDLVPYTLIRDSCRLVQRSSRRPGATERDARVPWLQELLRGSKLSLPLPPKREKSPELVARLQKLQENLEWKQYSELVKDVDSSYGQPHVIPFMATFRQQAAFGLNVVTLMVTGYAVGHTAMAALYRTEKHLHPLGGALGLVVSMMVEVLLYVIIAERVEEKQRMIIQESERSANKTNVPDAPAFVKPTSSSPSTEILPQMLKVEKTGPRQRKKVALLSN